MWKVVTSSNLNSLLKLFFYLSILTNSNLLFKIYCENITKILWQYFSIRIFYFLYYFSLFHFIFIPTRFISFFLFSCSCFSPPHKCPLSLSPFFYFLFHLKNIPVTSTSTSHERERERERSPKGQSQWRSAFTMQHYHVRRPTAVRPPPHHLAGLDRLVLFFFFFPHICLF